MTRIFQPDPARNPLAEAMAKLDAQKLLATLAAKAALGDGREGAG